MPLAAGTLVATPQAPPRELIPSYLAASDVLGTGWFAVDAANVKPGATVVVVGDGALVSPGPAMSEYQFYEFVTVDRSLTAAEREALRRVSSRAEITATRFVNVYNYGDLKADPLALLDAYFDAWIYDSNFGRRVFAVRLPRAALTAKAVAPYLREYALELKTTAKHHLLQFICSDEDGSGWVDEGESAAWMTALLPIRAMLLGGDLRPLFIAWLAGAARERAYDDDDDDADAGDDTDDPPVPPGLRKLDAALDALVEFVGLEPTVLAAAAARSAASPAVPTTRANVKLFLARRPVADKDRWLARVVAGEGQLVAAEITRAMRAAPAKRRAAPAARRAAPATKRATPKKPRAPKR